MESYKEATDAQLLDKPQIKEIIHEFFNTLGIHGGSKETASRIKEKRDLPVLLEKCFEFLQRSSGCMPPQSAQPCFDSPPPLPPLFGGIDSYIKL